MKITEEKEIEIEIEEPRFGVYSYRDAEVLPSLKDFKLSKVELCLNPSQLELVFLTNNRGQQKSGWFRPKEGSVLGTVLLEQYKKEIEEKLIGKTWEEVLTHDFLFREASRI